MGSKLVAPLHNKAWPVITDGNGSFGGFKTFYRHGIYRLGTSNNRQNIFHGKLFFHPNKTIGGSRILALTTQFFGDSFCSG